ncbi:flagellar filament capping protein FliD [Curtobacterium sp. MCBD17_003]|uniref:flagellar filament capping protein FliD n=1 Tax=Curtobacterium sp. MCBD17_003 TaxID=2175667 RepID=UPI0021ABAF76|nr:flagellar filament capping protein FliD [Curtobacterium sp. MCBD17_003]WIE56022.1 flagellar filament capping protein FliD [Curtobacterium sp. MCBD17_003]
MSTTSALTTTSTSASGTLGIDGLASGLDTTSIINSLMSIEQLPQSLLQDKVTSTSAFISSLQTINGLFATMATKATAAATSTSLNLLTASSSSSAVTASVSSTAAAGSVSFTVGSTAATQVGVTAAMTTWSSSAPTLTLVSASGAKTEISPASGSLDDVVSAINKAGAGVTATKVAAGTTADGTKQYRLQLTATASGSAGAFSLYRGSGSDVDAGTATNVLTESGAAVVQQASDASVTLWAGTAAAQTITSSTNTFTDLVPGLTVNVSAVSASPVTINVAQDTTKATAVASGLVDALNAITSYYSSNTSVSTTTSATDGSQSTTAGVLLGDATTRDAVQQITSAMSTPVNGQSPSSIGIEITKDGDFTFDSDAFQAALATDPAGTQKILSGLAQNVANVANGASDKYSGSITTAITGQQSVVTDLNQQISDWDTRLADRRATLQEEYTNLETNLSTLKSQSTWLTSQISSLPSYSSSSK